MSAASPDAAALGRELFVRHAKKDGRSVTILRAVDYGSSCVVEAEVYPQNSRNTEAMRPGPYTFADAHQLSTGIRDVWVNGVRVLSAGKHTGATPGCVVSGRGHA